MLLLLWSRDTFFVLFVYVFTFSKAFVQQKCSCRSLSQNCFLLYLYTVVRSEYKALKAYSYNQLSVSLLSYRACSFSTQCTELSGLLSCECFQQVMMSFISTFLVFSLSLHPSISIFLSTFLFCTIQDQTISHFAFNTSFILSMYLSLCVLYLFTLSIPFNHFLSFPHFLN